MPAVAALPDLDLALLKDLLHLNVMQQCAVSLLVMLLNGGHHPEFHGKLMKALLLRCFRKLRVHLGPLVVLAFRRVLQILLRLPDSVQLLEPELCMLLLIVRCLLEDRCHLFEAVLLRL